MNSIKQIQQLNERELEEGIPIEASWHNDYKDTAYVYIGGLPRELTEGDVLTIFSQFGNPVHLNLARDKETGKSKGFAFLKYEDQRSTVLAVDNFNGTEIMGRKIRVDHTRYEPKEGEEEYNAVVEFLQSERGSRESRRSRDRDPRDRRRGSRERRSSRERRGSRERRDSQERKSSAKRDDTRESKERRESKYRERRNSRERHRDAERRSERKRSSREKRERRRSQSPDRANRSSQREEIDDEDPMKDYFKSKRKSTR